MLQVRVPLAETLSLDKHVKSLTLLSAGERMQRHFIRTLFGDRLMSQRGGFLAAVALVAACVTSSCSRGNDDAEVNASLKHLVAAVSAKDINGIMEYYVPDETLLVFDALPPRQFVGAAAHRKNWESFLAAYPGTVHAEVSDWKTETEGNLSVGHGIFRITGPYKDGTTSDVTVRFTDVFRKINGKWLVIHEHVSWPVDLATGKADLTSKP
jgi:ketosteroid isomerase-like protein